MGSQIDSHIIQNLESKLGRKLNSRQWVIPTLTDKLSKRRMYANQWMGEQSKAGQINLRKRSTTKLILWKVNNGLTKRCPWNDHHGRNIPSWRKCVQLAAALLHARSGMPYTGRWNEIIYAKISKSERREKNQWLRLIFWLGRLLLRGLSTT